MVLLRWSEKLSVGVDRLDREHRHWIDLFNQLHDATLAGEPCDVLDAVLGAVKEYTRTHFADEERLLEKHGYPLLDNHRQLHQDFVREIEAWMDVHRAGNLQAALEVMDIMRDWLVHHIQRVDQAYAPFLAARVSPEEKVHAAHSAATPPRDPDRRDH